MPIQFVPIQFVPIQFVIDRPSPNPYTLGVVYVSLPGSSRLVINAIPHLLPLQWACSALSVPTNANVNERPWCDLHSSPPAQPCNHYLGLTRKKIQLLRNHMNVVSAVANTLFSALFLAGKLLPTIPPMLTRTAFLGINLISIAYLSYQWNIVAANTSACDLAWKVHDVACLVLFTLCLTNAVSDLLLITLSAAAAIAAWVGRRDFQLLIYQYTRPWGVGFLFVAMALDFFNYLNTRVLVDKIRALKTEPNAKRRVNQVMAVLVTHNNNSAIPETVPKKERHLAAQLRKTIPWTTLEALIKKVDRPSLFFNHRRLVQPLLDSVEGSCSVTRNDVAIRVIGYVTLFIGKAHPDTLLQAATQFGVSSLFTANTLYSTWINHRDETALRTT